MISWLFGVCVVTGLVAAYVLRYRFSGRNFRWWIFWACLVFNLFFSTYYMRVVERSYLLFIGFKPDFLYENPAAVWWCLVGMVLHSFAMPVQWEPKRWFGKK